MLLLQVVVSSVEIKYKSRKSRPFDARRSRLMAVPLIIPACERYPCGSFEQGDSSKYACYDFKCLCNATQLAERGAVHYYIR